MPPTHLCDGDIRIWRQLVIGRSNVRLPNAVGLTESTVNGSVETALFGLGFEPPQTDMRPWRENPHQPWQGGAEIMSQHPEVFRDLVQNEGLKGIAYGHLRTVKTPYHHPVTRWTRCRACQERQVPTEGSHEAILVAGGLVPVVCLAVYLAVLNRPVSQQEDSKLVRTRYVASTVPVGGGSGIPWDVFCPGHKHHLWCGAPVTLTKRGIHGVWRQKFSCGNVGGDDWRPTAA